MKECTKCHKEKKINDFHRHGKNATCYSCRDEEQEENLKLIFQSNKKVKSNEC